MIENEKSDRELKFKDILNTSARGSFEVTSKSAIQATKKHSKKDHSVPAKRSNPQAHKYSGFVETSENLLKPTKNQNLQPPVKKNVKLEALAYDPSMNLAPISDAEVLTAKTSAAEPAAKRKVKNLEKIDGNLLSDAAKMKYTGIAMHEVVEAPVKKN